MTYITLCSGIEAMSVAVSGMNWKPLAFSEIDPRVNGFLSVRYPCVPNLGDMTRITAVDGGITNGKQTVTITGDLGLIAAGTPCQDVSTVGTLRGMCEGSGTRSALAFEFARIISELRPRWILWENVKGAVSGRNREAFRHFVERIVDAGYHVAWRVIDSSRFGIPQRRHRVWLVGHRDDLAARNGILGKVLLERILPERGPSENEGEGQDTGCDTSEGARICVDLYNGRVTGGTACTYGANSFGTNTAGPKLMVVGKGFRRFAPVEVERMFGFPDGYTEPLGTDAVRCRGLGNSWPVPVVTEIAKRIERSDCQ